MLTLLLLIAAAFLAFSNGANDNFKGVASLYGGGVASYRAALTWATITTAAGAVCSLVLAEALLHKFTGRGLIPDALAASQPFVLAVALGAAATVMLASRLGFPVSTTHALLGGLGGAGLAAGGTSALNISALGNGFLAPLLLSPFLAISLAGAAHFIFDRFRARSGSSREACVCVGVDVAQAAVSADGVVALPGVAGPRLHVRSLPAAACVAQTPGAVGGIDLRGIFNKSHWLSAGAVSFARGLNDTPKIAALLLIVRAVAPSWEVAIVAGAMAAGGVFGARKVAETMSRKITHFDPAEGLIANFTTAALVLSASGLGLPISTTHVSVGSLFGIGLTKRQADHRTMQGIVLSWLVTLPCAAGLSASLATLFALARL